MTGAAMESGSKINLFLRVTGCRADGYHTVETLFLPLALPSDVLEIDFGAAPGISLDCGDPVLSGNSNLAYRAAELYADASGIVPSWKIRLEKRIPVAAGLGGGSADAAAVLTLLEGRYGAAGMDGLKRLALRLGADVPFFLYRVPMTGRGIGDELTALAEPLPKLHILLVNPGFPVRAKWAYDHLAAGAGKGATLERLLAALAARDWVRAAANIRNDLAAALWKKFPLLGMIRDELAALGAFAVEVSGSGPTLFALFPDGATLTLAAEKFRSEHENFRIFATEYE